MLAGFRTLEAREGGLAGGELLGAGGRTLLVGRLFWREGFFSHGGDGGGKWEREGGKCGVPVNDVDDALCDEDMRADDLGAVDEDVAGVGGDVHVFGDEGGEGGVDVGVGAVGWR